MRQPVALLAIGKEQDNKDKSESLWCMILKRRSPSEGEYERIGLLQIEDFCEYIDTGYRESNCIQRWLDRAEVTTVTIV